MIGIVFPDVTEMHHARKRQTHWRENGRLFYPQYKYIQNSQSLRGYIFFTLKHFEIKLGNFTNLKVLFRAVVEDFVRLPRG